MIDSKTTIQRSKAAFGVMDDDACAALYREHVGDVVRDEVFEDAGLTHRDWMVLWFHFVDARHITVNSNRVWYIVEKFYDAMPSMVPATKESKKRRMVILELCRFMKVGTPSKVEVLSMNRLVRNGYDKDALSEMSGYPVAEIEFFLSSASAMR